MTRHSHATRRNLANYLVIADETRGTGSHYYVHSADGDSGNAGTNPDAPFATIQQAIEACTSNQGDSIWVMPGHAETLTAAEGIACSKIGISINGIGNGTNRPTITLGTSVNTDVNISAVNVTIRNLRFVSSIDSLVNFLDVDADWFTCEDCDFITSNTFEVLTFVDIATTKDNFTFRRCRFFQPTDPAGTDGNAGTGCFYFVDSENLFFEDCFFSGFFESAIWHNKTTAANNVWIRNCYGHQLLTGAEIFIQVADMRGGIMGSLLVAEGGTDVTEAQVTGTISNKFFVNVNSGFGNDGGGGQLAVAVAGAAT